MRIILGIEPGRVNGTRQVAKDVLAAMVVPAAHESVGVFLKTQIIDAARLTTEPAGMNKTSPPSRRERRTSARARARIAPSVSTGRSRWRRRWIGAGFLLALGLGAGVAFGLTRPATIDPASLIPPAFDTPAFQAESRMLGSMNARVTIDVWSDFQCQSCALFAQSSMPTVITKYVIAGQARLVFHDLANVGPESITAALAARSADEQGHFWPYHDWLFANQGRENSGTFSRERLVAIATAVGLDVPKFIAYLDDVTSKASLNEEIGEGQGLGVVSGPAVFVNGQRVASFDATTIGIAIDKALGADVTPGQPGPGSPGGPIVVPTPFIPNPNPPAPAIPTFGIPGLP